MVTDRHPWIDEHVTIEINQAAAEVLAGTLNAVIKHKTGAHPDHLPQPVRRDVERLTRSQILVDALGLYIDHVLDRIEGDTS